MSSYATAWAWDQEIPNAKLLLLFLADNADQYGEGSGLKQLLKDAPRMCCVSDQTIQYHWWDELLKADLVRETDNDGYHLTLSKEREPALPVRFRLRL
jgi:hypothetical protein